MNKDELIRSASANSGIPICHLEKTLEAIEEAVIGALEAGERVKLVGFGTWEAKHRAPRTGRNPQTGERVEIPERYIPVFVPGKRMKEAVEGLR